MKKVVCAMSGGVDSAVAAYILKQQGYDVIGVTMQIWQKEGREAAAAKGGCCGLTAVEDARFVCHALGIPHYVLNFRDIFRTKVIDYFAEEYQNGRTPNPCIACNRYIKWESLLEQAIVLGADCIATGHYSKIETHPDTGRLTIVSSPHGKDQSYALYNLTQDQLTRTLFPIGGLADKDMVRKIAFDEFGLRVAHKPDSQEICFIPDNNHPKFLQEHFGAPLAPGNFVDEAENVLGAHLGIGHYTIGQRKGLGMSFGRPMYVKEIDILTGNVVLADEAALFKTHGVIDDINFMSHIVTDKIECRGKIRYSHKAAPCTIWREKDKLRFVFDTPQRAITPGQSAVFYDNTGRIICGGNIL